MIVEGSRRVVIVSARIGAGHDGAATELARRMRQRGFLVDRHDYLDLLPGRLGQRMCDAYHRELQVAPRSWDWLLRAFGSPPLARLATRLATLARPKLRDAIGAGADLVVSTYPLASHALADVRARGLLSAPLAVYLTDPSVHRLSVTPRADMHLAPNDHAATAVRRLSGRATVAAPVVAPGFRLASGAAERSRARESFGLAPDERLALVLSGSWGVGQVEETAEDIAATGAARPVVVCGRNEALRRRLGQDGPARVFGWVDDMPALMRACDLVVQNAGGLTTLEALASGLPVLTYRCLPGHGRANARVLDEIGLVPWVRDAGGLRDALASAAAAGPLAGPDPAFLLGLLAGQAEVEMPAA